MRKRQTANLIVSLCLSNGVPMLVAGDERGRTQGGNNNAYAQDNETSWVDWRAEDAWLDVYELTKKALRIRRDHPALRQRHWFEGRPTIVGGPKDLAWIHPAGREMTPEDWQDDGLAVVGMFVSGGSTALTWSSRRAVARLLIPAVAQWVRQRRRSVFAR
ncbi:MAG: hypothetical protein V9E81_08155 [Marmoricola sp.]